jgi:hypothetical protein
LLSTFLVSFSISSFTCRDELAEVEPSTKGVKKRHHQQTDFDQDLNESDGVNDVASDDEVGLEIPLHGKGLETENRELFAVQHRGTFLAPLLKVKLF